MQLVVAIKNDSSGLYTLEGAFAITIFASLFMMLLSLIAVMRVEMVVQYAINETAMQLSQYSYVGESIKEQSPELQLCVDAGKSDLCKLLIKKNFHRNDIDIWLKRQGVCEGYEGFNFSGSRLLDGNGDISIVAIYKLKLSAFGNSSKTLTICQKAQTAAWLCAADRKALDEDESIENIWQKNSFVRGKYFVRKVKAESPDASVKSGQGIDLYFKKGRVIAEVYSMHVFMPSYSSISPDVTEKDYSPSSYKADDEAICKQIIEYSEKFDFDIDKTQRLIDMEDGSLANFGRLNEKQLILIVPKEAEGIESFNNSFKKVSSKIKNEKDMTLVIRYCEEAF